METFADLIAALQSDMTIGNESTLFDPTTVKLALNRAYIKAGGFYKWPETEDSLETSTAINQEYYDYPQNWRSNSIYKLEVDGVDYGDPLVLKDYIYEKENKFPSGRTTLWSNQQRRYFIYPIPATDGNNNISIWGQKVVDKLVGDTDVTIFSYSMPECNDAVVMEALAILRNKGEILQPVMRSYIGGTQLLSFVAQNTLTVAWGKIQQEKNKYEKTKPMLDVNDMFGRTYSNVKNKIGNF